MTNALLTIHELKVHYETSGGLFSAGSLPVRAVDGVSLELKRGELLALVGESGCGKSTIARTLVGLTEPTAGDIIYAGQNVGNFSPQERQNFRRSVQMVFQDPFDSLNPRKTVFSTIAQPLRIHKIVPRAELKAEVIRLLNAVGLSPAEAYLGRYPHQFSGGQRQRICIARAIASRPKIIIADEAVSALDVSIRAQILTLFRKLTQELDLASIFITHDLSVVRSLCESVAVMYLGQVVERGPTERVFTRPQHPYTRALLQASPIADPDVARSRRGFLLEGDVPSPANPPAGCRFHTRCPIAQPKCASEPPALRSIEGVEAACHFPEGWRQTEKVSRAEEAVQ
ncbi:ABC transporter ATP-binding protein [Afifella marina]|uniref:Oligopeptide transport system ATP-binding protein n=1 Tax=Afifella marina DSM 2698 TaxID=1120955 RepID=A0A1G5NVK6_AFIMA|nr:oligopeptide/dipeptide ABC transporter ATP-binding protein [Afifella marina]MBK1624108.1 peptide ABC transporter ATP-binding protein [Afifella marina DSM 2698]MBK1627665.1 peptide ABC transporter ATP-binding protein [Afifella marina]MBK5916389.1 peptide ABC transporter ATP-binding protein [Afifella marina]RAI20947.1 peptide ABC transporter ATP-binding protein [Afifella marina DSM 2698]SCZ40869.1 oligopeptide transport system ATP-binding protein [Afifella marina DSM 2698]